MSKCSEQPLFGAAIDGWSAPVSVQEAIYLIIAVKAEIDENAEK
jgi:hypothetical protein